MNETGDWEAVLNPYFKEVSSCEPLSRQREVELAERIKNGDWRARNELVQANLRFVIEVAKAYQHRGQPLADLISAGNVGLIAAAERFDGRKGFKFITYAGWRIKQAIRVTLADCSRNGTVTPDRAAFAAGDLSFEARSGSGGHCRRRLSKNCCR